MSGRDELEKIKRLRAQEDEIKVIVSDIVAESGVFERIVYNLIDEYVGEMNKFSRELDKLMRDIEKGHTKKYSELKLEMRCLSLANAMYKATDGLAIIGSQSDMTKVIKERKFAEAYSKIKDGTIPDKKAEAMESILQEIMVEKVMDRAYTIVGQKLKSANRTLEAIKKILTSRMIHKEVFRKESGVLDEISSEEIREGFEDTGDEFDE